MKIAIFVGKNLNKPEKCVFYAWKTLEMPEILLSNFGGQPDLREKKTLLPVRMIYVIIKETDFPRSDGKLAVVHKLIQCSNEHTRGAL